MWTDQDYPDENDTHCQHCGRTIPLLSDFYGGGRDMTRHADHCPVLAAYRN